MDVFIRGLFGDGKVERHKLTPRGSPAFSPIMLCDAGGWGTDNDDDVNCRDCLAIDAGTAELLPRPLDMY